MKKFLTALFLCVLISSMAYADGFSFETAKKDRYGNLIDFTTEAGLRILYMGTFRNALSSSDEAGADNSDNIFSVFMVKSNKDTQLKLDIREGVDTKTNNFRWREGAAWGYIANVDTNGTPRDILEDIWVRVTFWHHFPRSLGERAIIGRVGFVINDNEITYKRIRPRPYDDWPEVEQEIIRLEDGEDEDLNILFGA